MEDLDWPDDGLTPEQRARFDRIDGLIVKIDHFVSEATEAAKLHDAWQQRDTIGDRGFLDLHRIYLDSAAIYGDLASALARSPEEARPS